ncbi:Hypothetical protein CINCED_3A021285 [Cinara cedri]|uniref:Uncharacterized protein n=1 Tax=Cinara cedri TaxID=506608 RepID=A0A5E4MTU9_9HEMI|nr:Hypothetical protein CINCED_3A021285 [Cinara cedri]
MTSVVLTPNQPPVLSVKLKINKIKKVRRLYGRPVRQGTQSRTAAERSDDREVARAPITLAASVAAGATCDSGPVDGRQVLRVRHAGPVRKQREINRAAVRDATRLHQAGHRPGPVLQQEVNVPSSV